MARLYASFDGLDLAETEQLVETCWASRKLLDTSYLAVDWLELGPPDEAIKMA